MVLYRPMGYLLANLCKNNTLPYVIYLVCLVYIYRAPTLSIPVTCYDAPTSIASQPSGKKKTPLKLFRICATRKAGM